MGRGDGVFPHGVSARVDRHRPVASAGARPQRRLERDCASAVGLPRPAHALPGQSVIAVPAAIVTRVPRWWLRFCAWWVRRLDPRDAERAAFIAEHQQKITTIEAWIDRLFP